MTPPQLIRGEVVAWSTKKWLHGRLAHWIDRLLWIIHPRQRLVYIYRADGSVSRLAPTDVLTGEAVLPGFEVTVAELLAGPPQTRLSVKSTP